MYAVEATVKNLVKNRRSNLSLEEIQAAAAITDPEIDAQLTNSFYWPKSSSGAVLNNPPPAAIVVIANLLTAALIESQSYAQNEAGQATANPYGRYLERRGRALLDGICQGKKIVGGLEGLSPVRGMASGSSSYEGVTGFPAARPTAKGRS